MTVVMQRPAFLHSTQRGPYKRRHSFGQPTEESQSPLEPEESSKRRKVGAFDPAGLSSFSSLSLENNTLQLQTPCQPESALHDTNTALGSSNSLSETHFRPSDDQEDEDFKGPGDAPSLTLHAALHSRLEELASDRKGIRVLPNPDPLPKPPLATSEPWGQLILYRPLQLGPELPSVSSSDPVSSQQQSSQQLEEPADDPHMMDLD